MSLIDKMAPKDSPRTDECNINASSWTPSYATASSSLPAAEISFITDTQGIIQTYNRREVASLRLPYRELKGMDLRECLVELKPHWQEQLQGRLVHLEKLMLPWTQDPQSAAAIEWTLLRHENLCFITLNPVHSLILDDDKRWTNFLKHFSGVCYRQRPDLSFRSISPNVEELLGLRLGSLLQSGVSFLNCIHPVDLNRLLNRLGNISPDENDIVTWQYRFRNPNTQKLHYLTDVREPLFSADGSFIGYEGILVDVTRQAVAEKRLSNASWQQNLSTLISGMAHDFGNIMTGVYSFSDSIQTKVEEDSDVAKGLQNITQYAMEANKLIRRMVDISRNQCSRKQLHNLDNLLGEQIDLIQIILGRRFQLNVEKPDKELPVYIDDFGFRQVLLNFASNSRDAITGEGEIHMFLQELDRSELIQSNDMDYGASDRWAELIFADSGPGVRQDLAEKLFDPFYSTKDPSKGSGLGLYNARVFCEEHGGAIQVQSGEDKGFTVVIHLPILDEASIQQIIRHKNDQAVIEVPGVVYLNAGKNKDSALLQQMNERKWKVYEAHDVSKLEDPDFPKRPDLVIIDHCTVQQSGTESVDHLNTLYPKSTKALNLFGVNPDEVENRLTSRFDLVLDDPTALEKLNLLEKSWKANQNNHG